ncbi:MAG: hypothetical protein DHS20C18_45040 [Saprospiraceae bacterium]|nr:MAG: hypothetical protein DHS20C18_45040 [Saprospiraceae bacterium]
MKEKLILFIFILLTVPVFGQYCAKTLSDGFSVYITQFRLGTIDQTSVDSDYSDYTASSTNLLREGSYTAIVNNVGGPGQNGRVYIDWNQDEDFEDTDETISFSTAGSGETNVPITVPADATLGNTRLRLIVAWNGNPSGTSACAPSGGVGFEIGDVEDYSLVIMNVLPIELIAFSALPIGNRIVSLNWQTATEINNDYFTIERSLDGRIWEEVTKYKGAGNSEVMVRYHLTDENPYMGVSYYRLKQTDYNGEYSYSKVEAVNIDKVENASIHIYPNPTSDQINLEGDQLEINKLKIFTVLGRDVSSFVKVINQNETRITLDLTNLPLGGYTIITGTTSYLIFRE